MMYIIVTEAEPRSLLHHPRPTTRHLNLVVLSEVSNRLIYGTRIVERLVASRFGPLESYSLDEAEGTNELTSDLDLPQLFSRRRGNEHSGILPRYLELPWGAYRLNSGPGGGQTQDLTS